MEQKKTHYWHFDVWNKATTARSIRLTTVRFSIRTTNKMMVTSAIGIVQEQIEKLVADEYIFISQSIDVRWDRNGHAYVMGVRNKKYDINLQDYA